MDYSRNTISRFFASLMVVSCIVAVCGLAACDDDPAAPGIEPEIINSPESFEFQVSRVQSYSGTLEYTWANAESQANIDESASLTRGTVRLTILDDEGTVVHDADLTDGSFATDSGMAGNWTVRVRFTNVTGALNFRVQPRTP